MEKNRENQDIPKELQPGEENSEHASESPIINAINACICESFVGQWPRDVQTQLVSGVSKVLTDIEELSCGNWRAVSTYKEEGVLVFAKNGEYVGSICRDIVESSEGVPLQSISKGVVYVANGALSLLQNNVSSLQEVSKLRLKDRRYGSNSSTGRQSRSHGNFGPSDRS